MNILEAACFRAIQKCGWFTEVHAKAFLAVVRYRRCNLSRLGFLLEEGFASLEPKLEELVQAGVLQKHGGEYCAGDALEAVGKLVDAVEANGRNANGACTAHEPNAVENCCAKGQHPRGIGAQPVCARAAR